MMTGPDWRECWGTTRQQRKKNKISETGNHSDAKFRTRHQDKLSKRVGVKLEDLRAT